MTTDQCRNCGEPLTDEECTNPWCPEWRFGAELDAIERETRRGE